MIYEIKRFEATDVFALVKVIKKAGVSNFVEVFTSVQNNKDENKNAIGMKLLEVLVARIVDCEEEIYEFLSRMSGLSLEETTKLDADVFMQLIYDVVENPKFVDFLKVAFKFAK